MTGRPRAGRAFAPGHLTGIFRAAGDDAPDPRARGSIGVGLVLELGARAEARWEPGPRRSIAVRSRDGAPLPITQEAVRRLVGDRRGRMRVDLHHELPIGQGFGMSAAGTLAAALAVSRAIGAPRRRAIEVAHLAELDGGGGLGGVAAILGGGLEIRRRPGVPPWGRIDHRPGPARIWVALAGRGMATPPLLSDPDQMHRVLAASSRLPALLRAPSIAGFARASERFTDRLGLAPPPLRAALRRLRRSGAWAAQSMFGASLFAIPRSRAAEPRIRRALAELGLPAVEIGCAVRGAHLLPPIGPPDGRRKDFRGGPARRRP